MRSAVSLVCSLVLACLLASTGGGRGQETSSQPPVFRTGVDVLQLDVTVLDRDRRPVRGLTAKDFTILEDGQRRSIVGFSGVELAPPPSEPPAGLALIAPDVTTNALPAGRLVVILLDDSTKAGGPVVLARQIATAAIDALGPGDLAAVVQTSSGIPQNFTADRALLKRAVQDTSLGMNPPAGDTGRGENSCGSASLRAIRRAAEALTGEPQRRKTLLFIGENIPIKPDDNWSASARCNEIDETMRMLRAAQLANLTVHALDPNGLEVTSVGASENFRSESLSAAAAGRERANREGILIRHGNLRSLAEETGGRVVLNTNAPIDSIRGILDETGAYYLLAVQLPEARMDGRFRGITVRVNRPDVEVRTRRGYYAPRRERKTRSDRDTSSEPLHAALRRTFPDPGLPLSLVAMPFADADRRSATILFAAAVGSRPVTAGGEPQAAPASARHERLEIVASALPASGGDAVWHRQSMQATLGTAAPGDPLYGAVARLQVRPGRYEVRLGISHGVEGRLGTVHGYVDVPDFARERLSLSGVALHHGQPPLVTPASLYGDLLSARPTPLRDFAPDDDVAASVRVYQRRSGNTVPVVLTFRILDGMLEPVWAREYALAPGDFDASRSASRAADLPLADLAPGDYVLSVAASAGDASARRDVRFRLR